MSLASGASIVNEYLDLVQAYLRIARSSKSSLIERRLGASNEGSIDGQTSQTELASHCQISSKLECSILIGIFNSKRDSQADFRRAINELLERVSIAAPARFILLDNGSRLRFMRMLFFRAPLLFSLSLIKAFSTVLCAGRMASVSRAEQFVIVQMFLVFRGLFRSQAAPLLLLATSNNRLAEFARACAVSTQVPHIELLHGICTRMFEPYYRSIARTANKASSPVGYVNLSADLPQPQSIARPACWSDQQATHGSGIHFGEDSCLGGDYWRLS